MMHTGDSVLGTSEYDSYGAVSPRRLTIMRNRNTHTHLHIRETISRQVCSVMLNTSIGASNA